MFKKIVRAAQRACTHYFFKVPPSLGTLCGPLGGGKGGWEIFRLEHSVQSRTQPELLLLQLHSHPQPLSRPF